ncbi:MAG TPA: FkbM family methyltransferase [Magnetospirillaceae bacterium]|jgi:FkbM family methyltransferase
MKSEQFANRILRHETFSRSTAVASFNHSPLGLVDVGARGDVDPVLTQLAEVSAVLAFEPDAEEAKRLQAKGNGIWASVVIEPSALADRDGEARLYLASEPNNHSLRRPNRLFTDRYAMEKFVEVGSEKLATTTLDRILFEKYAERPWLGEILKVDTQGTELDVLKGAERTLQSRTAAIICEVEFAPIYQDQPLFADVERWLRDRGFAFFGFSEQHGRSRKRLDKTSNGGRERLLWSDAIFFKDPLATAQSAKGQERLADCLVVAATMLGFYDYALEVAEWSSAERPDGRAYYDVVKTLVEDLSRLDPESARADVQKLADAVKAEPAKSNVLVGQFVDRRRKLHDYDDVRMASPWSAAPQTLGWEPSR